jgi:Polyketide cyclase / dehydrase and lipid transport
MHEIAMRQRFTATPDRVFAAITDHAALGSWLPADVRLESPGIPPPNGVGAVRVVRVRGLSIREQVTRFEAPRAMDYRVISGAPFQDHLGQIRVAADGEGALVDYRIGFGWPWYAGGPLVGHLVAGQLEREITAGLARLAASLPALESARTRRA